MNRKLRTVLVALGAEFLFVSLFLMCCSLWETRKAERSVAELLPQVVSSIEEACEQPVTTDENEAGVEIDGNRYLGYLSIPSLELELPVMYEWDYDCLNTSPCRYAGTTKTKDLIIAAHNYSGHFGRVPELSPRRQHLPNRMESGSITIQSGRNRGIHLRFHAKYNIRRLRPDPG
jgi:sortase A